MATVLPRQESSGNLTSTREPPTGFVEENGRFIPYWYSREGYIIKWSVFWGILLLFSLYLLIGYTHAKRRIKKGLKPLGYHRWLVSRAELARIDPRYAYPQANYTAWPGQPYYGMQAMPPPIYDPNRPPMYEGPNGAKINPNQMGMGMPPPPNGEYAPPAGPPPAQLRPERTGNTNPFSDPSESK